MQAPASERHAAVAAVQSLLCKGFVGLRHLAVAFFTAVALSSLSTNVPAQPSDGVVFVNQYGANDLEVRRDALPDELPLDQIEVVVEASDEQCKVKPATLFGFNLPLRLSPLDAYFCGTLAAYLGEHAGELSVRRSIQPWLRRKVTEQIANLDGGTQRRYVLLSRWRPYNADVNQYGYVGSVRWVVEEVLWDTAESRLLWHSLRNIYANEFQQGRLWGLKIQFRQYFSYTLPATLSRRGAVRGHAPVPGGRWVPTAEIEGWQSDSRGAIAFVNKFPGSGARDFSRSRIFFVRSVTQQPYRVERFEWGSEAQMRAAIIDRVAATPPIDYGTHGLLELPPGRYVIDPYDPAKTAAFEIDLKSGELAVVELRRKFIGADSPELSDIETWKQALARGRHAFLEDARVLPDPWQVECWFVGPEKP